jgi:hypothetical protein
MRHERMITDKFGRSMEAVVLVSNKNCCRLGKHPASQHRYILWMKFGANESIN